MREVEGEGKMERSKEEETGRGATCAVMTA